MSIELPPEVARQFLKDLRAFFAETDPIKADGIAARSFKSSVNIRDRGRRSFDCPTSKRCSCR